MEISRTKNVSRNIFWGLLSKIVALGIPFATRTVMLYVMGIQYVGLGSLFTSILQVLSFTELGIGEAMVFSMYKPVAEGDDSTVCALMNFYKKAYRAIGLVILLLGLAVMPFLGSLIAGDVPPDINLQALFGIYLFNNVIGYFLFAYKQSVFTATQRVDYISKVGMVLQLVSGIAQSVLLIVFKNYYVFAIVIPAITVINNLVLCLLSNKYYPQYKCNGSIGKNELKDIRKNVGGLFFHKVGNIVLISADTIVISSFLGLRILGIYNGYYYVIQALMAILGIILQSLIPSVGNSIIKEDKEKNYSDFNLFHFIYVWITIWFCACMFSLYQPFIYLWQGEDNMLSMTMVALLTCYFFTYKMGDIIYIYREAMGLWWRGKLVPIVSAAVNLSVNIALVKWIGLPGVVISTIVSLTFILVPCNAVVLFKYYYNSLRKFGRFILNLIIYFSEATLATGITWIVCKNISETSVAGLVGRAAICAVLPNLVLLAINIKNPKLKSSLMLAKNIIKRGR